MKQSRGFTLIELLVVFTLLALLLTIAVPRYLTVANNSSEKARAQNIATIRDALDKFKADQGSYPEALNELVTKQYLRKIPIDPVTGTTNWTTVSEPNTGNAGVYDVTAPAPGIVEIDEHSPDTPTAKPGSLESLSKATNSDPVP